MFMVSVFAEISRTLTAPTSRTGRNHARISGTQVLPSPKTAGADPIIRCAASQKRQITSGGQKQKLEENGPEHAALYGETGAPYSMQGMGSGWRLSSGNQDEPRVSMRGLPRGTVSGRDTPMTDRERFFARKTPCENCHKIL
jgi:hypothetical protein